VSAISVSPSSRSVWRAVALPTEHGGWGLTAEPALLGVLVAPSWAGAAIGIAAFLVFLVRTPLKVVLVDRRRGRRLERTRHATVVAIGELALIALLVGVALAQAGATWMFPVMAALPLFGIELWYDTRSRSRRLLPELCGAVGIASVVSAIVLADGRSATLAVALWTILAARAIASVAFARGQVLRLRNRATSTVASDVAQLAGIALAVAAAMVDDRLVAGAVCVLAVVSVQFAWSRGPARAAKVVGLWQMVFGLVVVAGAALGVLAS
jgi:YwiC-like protein